MRFSIKKPPHLREICMQKPSKTHHVVAKNKTWHTIPLLLPTRQSRELNFTKMARCSATYVDQFVKNDSKKNTPRGGKKSKMRVCLHYPLLHHQNVPCATIPNAPNGQFYKNRKGLLTSGQINGTIVISMR